MQIMMSWTTRRVGSSFLCTNKVEGQAGWFPAARPTEK